MSSLEFIGHGKRLLKSGGCPDELVLRLSAHSTKATLLSWAAKAGLSNDTRRALGGHAKPKDRSTSQSATGYAPISIE